MTGTVCPECGMDLDELDPEGCETCRKEVERRKTCEEVVRHMGTAIRELTRMNAEALADLEARAFAALDKWREAGFPQGDPGMKQVQKLGVQLNALLEKDDA